MIVETSLTAEEYVRHEAHTQMPAPANCSNCGKPGTLKAHAYYRRYTTGSQGRDLRHKVRRFICKFCRVTISCLPSFVQPYRKIANATIEAAILGDNNRPDVQRNWYLLRKYLATLSQECCARMGNYFGLAPPGEDKTAFWRKAVLRCGSFAGLTMTSVNELSITCFGVYKCHQRHS